VSPISNFLIGLPTSYWSFLYTIGFLDRRHLVFSNRKHIKIDNHIVSDAGDRLGTRRRRTGGRERLVSGGRGLHRAFIRAPVGVLSWQQPPGHMRIIRPEGVERQECGTCLLTDPGKASSIQASAAELCLCPFYLAWCLPV
jgi:hypothetical protein